MKTTSRKVLLSLTAVALGAVLTFGATPANAQTVSPPPVKALTMKQLNQRTPTFAEQESLKNGDMVTISDDGTVTGKKWQGTFVYRTAGSVVPMDNMYVRWKDGLVAITPHLKDGKPDGTCDCTFVEQKYATFKGPEDRSKDKNDVKDILTLVGQEQTLKPLVADPGDNSILRMPGNAWLFRNIGNGQYITLVDAFVWTTVEKPIGVADNQG
jgi:hypothetical protein